MVTGAVKERAWVSHLFRNTLHPLSFHLTTQKPCDKTANLPAPPAVEENFVITTPEYRPPFIRCQPQAPATHPESSACATILNTMKASTGQTRFVASGAGPADETLPQTLTEPTGQCTTTVGVTASEETSSWYDIWQAAVALDGMCARSGKAGLANFLGKGRKLTIEIKK